ncbi:MAG: DUF1877 family protein [Polyangiales bacterium]
MAMATYLQMVTLEELAALEADPSTINALNQETSVATHYCCTLNYFLTGNAYPDDHPLAALMMGTRVVDASTLENGNFGVVEPGEMEALVDALGKVDPEALRKAVEAADFDELIEEEELYELEVMEHSEVPGDLVELIASLHAMYEKASAENAAVVMFTT